MLRQWSAIVPIAALALISAAPSPAFAQTLHLGAGRSSYDLSGVGTTWAVVNARSTFRIAGPFHVEGGATYYRYTAQFGQPVSYLLPEVSAVLRASDVVEELSLYLGAGAGLGVGLEGDHRVRMTLHAATGFELRPDPRWGIRVEGRLRTFPFGSVMTDITVGPTFRF